MVMRIASRTKGFIKRSCGVPLRLISQPAATQPPTVDPNVANYTLPATAYYSAAQHELEKEHVVRKSWQLLGHSNAIFPSSKSYAEMNIGGESIVVVRNAENDVSAYYNVCPHRAHELVKPKSSGELKSKAFVCPNHGWSFKTSTGELVKARFSEDVVDFCRSDFNLKKVPVKIVAGLVFANLDSSASPDSGVLGGPLEELLLRKIPGIDNPRMQRDAVKEGVMNANWKILVDNFLECYHCDIAHKAFVDMVDLNQYSTDITTNPHRIVFESKCKPENKAYCFSPTDPLQNMFFMWLWPYSVVYSAPGSPNMSILQFIPLSPTTTLRRSERFSVLEEDPQKSTKESNSDAELQAQKRVEYLNQVLLEEDTTICESVQRGVQSSAYSRGRLMVAKGRADSQKWHTEIAVAQFHKLVEHYTAVK